MSKPIKELIAKELKTRYGAMNSAIVVNPIKLTALQANEMRRGLFKKNIQMELVKNSLVRLALKGTPAERVGDLMKGPSALLSGGESIVDLARELEEWTKKLKELEVLGALVEGDVVDGEGAKALAKMPTRVELQGQLVGLALSPGAKLASAITAPGGRIAGIVKALIEKLEQGESDAPAAA